MGSNLVDKSFSAVVVDGFSLYFFFLFLPRHCLIVLVPRETVLFENVWDIETLFTWGGGPRSSGVGFFCFVSPRA